jgi:predicted nucleic acid-binding protein
MENDYLIDASVLVEIVRDRFDKQKCLDYLDELNGNFYISTLTLSIVWHYATKPQTILNCKEFLSNFEVLDLTTNEVDLAYQIWNDEDFEDALQVASCLNHNIGKIITRDKGLAGKYSTLIEIDMI